MSAVGALIGVAGSAIQTGINYGLSRGLSDYDRERNHELNEEAARNADTRTRALYTDFYSPEALMRQYKAAGLSPSMMFGGTPGQGGIPGAQGGGSNTQTAFAPISLLEGVQAANIAAQTEKTKAETKNIESDTKIKDLQREWDDMRNKEKSVEFELSTSFVKNNDGSTTSIYELAQNCNDYDEFMNTARKVADEKQKLMMGTEAGQKVLRAIWMTANRYETEITELSNRNTSAKFQENLIRCLSTEGFEKQNAETIIKQLKAAGESADLTEEQKGAWNRVLERMRKKNSTAADYIIVASMIVNQAMSNYHLPGVNITNQYRRSNTTINDMR